MKSSFCQERFFENLQKSFYQIKLCLRIFFGFLLIELYIDIIPIMSSFWQSPPPINYWGVFNLVSLVPVKVMMLIGLVAGTLGLLGQMINPFNRWTQLLSFIYIFCYHCLEFGETGVSHEMLPYFWVTFLCCFFPHISRAQEPTRVDFLRSLYVFRMLLVVPCFFFFGAGFWKIYYGVVEGNLFSVTALNAHIAIFYNGVGWVGEFGKFLYKNPVLGYMGYLSVIIFEICAPLNLVYPRLNRFWILLIFMFVSANYLIFEIEFFRYLFICSVILYFAPFRLFVSKGEKSS